MCLYDVHTPYDPVPSNKSLSAAMVVPAAHMFEMTNLETQLMQRYLFHVYRCLDVDLCSCLQYCRRVLARA